KTSRFMKSHICHGQTLMIFSLLINRKIHKVNACLQEISQLLIWNPLQFHSLILTDLVISEMFFLFPAHLSDGSRIHRIDYSGHRLAAFRHPDPQRQKEFSDAWTPFQKMQPGIPFHLPETADSDRFRASYKNRYVCFLSIYSCPLLRPGAVRKSARPPSLLRYPSSSSSRHSRSTLAAETPSSLA